MLLPGRVADEARSTLNLDTERWIRNTGMHDFGWKYRLLYLAVAGLPLCDWLAGRACCSCGETDYRCTARKGPVCIRGALLTRLKKEYSCSLSSHSVINGSLYGIYHEVGGEIVLCSKL
jgi:hypothetical protein